MHKSYLKVTLAIVASFCLFPALDAHRFSSRKIHRPAYIEPKMLIFDIGNTLLTTSERGMGNAIGLGDFMRYKLLERKNPKKIQDLVFQILHSLKPLTSPDGARHTDGQILPEVMSDWLAGRQTAQQIVPQALRAIEYYDRQNFFSSKTEKKLVENSIRAILNPQVLAKHMHPTKGIVKLLEKCKQKGHSTSISSNMSTDLYNEVYYSREGYKVFNYFDPKSIMISGNTGLVKPQRTLFDLQLRTLNLAPHQCVFIDDIPENVAVARQCGMTGIVFTSSKQLERDLCALGIL